MKKAKVISIITLLLILIVMIDSILAGLPFILNSKIYTRMGLATSNQLQHYDRKNFMNYSYIHTVLNNDAIKRNELNMNVPQKIQSLAEYINESKTFYNAKIKFNNSIVIEENTTVSFVNSQIFFENLTLLINYGTLIIENSSIIFDIKILNPPELYILPCITNGGILFINSSLISLTNYYSYDFERTFGIIGIRSYNKIINIKNSIVANFSWGISLLGKNTTIIISNNTFVNNFIALEVSDSKEVQIIKNRFLGDNLSIRLSKVNNCTISNNTLLYVEKSNSNVIYNGYCGVITSDSNGIISNNYFLNLSPSIIVNGGNVTLKNNKLITAINSSSKGIVISSFKNVLIEKNILSGFGYSIYIGSHFSSKILVRENIIKNSIFGVYNNVTYFSLTPQGANLTLYENIFLNVSSINIKNFNTLVMNKNILKVKNIKIFSIYSVLFISNVVFNGSVSFYFCYSLKVKDNLIITDNFVGVEAVLSYNVMFINNQIEYTTSWKKFLLILIPLFLITSFILVKVHKTRKREYLSVPTKISNKEKANMVIAYIFFIFTVISESIYATILPLGLSFKNLLLAFFFLFLVFQIVMNKSIFKEIISVTNATLDYIRYESGKRLLKWFCISIFSIYAFPIIALILNILTYGTLPKEFYDLLIFTCKISGNFIFGIIIFLSMILISMISYSRNFDIFLVSFASLMCFMLIIDKVKQSPRKIVHKKEFVKTLWALRRCVFVLIFIFFTVLFARNSFYYGVIFSLEFKYTMIRFLYLTFVTLIYSTVILYLYINSDRYIFSLKLWKKLSNVRKYFFIFPTIYILITQSILGYISFWLIELFYFFDLSPYFFEISFFTFLAFFIAIYMYIVKKHLGESSDIENDTRFLKFREKIRDIIESLRKDFGLDPAFNIIILPKKLEEKDPARAIPFENKSFLFIDPILLEKEDIVMKTVIAHELTHIKFDTRSFTSMYIRGFEFYSFMSILAISLLYINIVKLLNAIIHLLKNYSLLLIYPHIISGYLLFLGLYVIVFTLFILLDPEIYLLRFREMRADFITTLIIKDIYYILKIRQLITSNISFDVFKRHLSRKFAIEPNRYLDEWYDDLKNPSISEIIKEIFLIKKNGKRGKDVRNLIIADAILKGKLQFESLPKLTDEDLKDFEIGDINIIKKLIDFLNKERKFPTQNIFKNIGYSNADFYNLILITLINLIEFVETKVKTPERSKFLLSD